MAHHKLMRQATKGLHFVWTLKCMD